MAAKARVESDQSPGPQTFIKVSLLPVMLAWNSIGSGEARILTVSHIVGRSLAHVTINQSQCQPLELSCYHNFVDEEVETRDG